MPNVLPGQLTAFADHAVPSGKARHPATTHV